VSELAELGLSQKGISADVMRRVRIVSLITAAMCLLGLVSSFQFWRLGMWDTSMLLTGTVVLAIANLFVLRVTARPGLCGHIGIGLLSLVIAITAASAGGYYNPNFGWFYVIPLCAAIVVGLRGAAAWTAVTLAVTVGFWLLPELGVDVPSRVPVELSHGHALFTRVLAILAIAGVGASFVTAQRRAERQFSQASQQHQRETVYVELLMHVAASANEATSFEEAMKESVERICRAMGWFAGHICVVNEDGSIGSSGFFWVQRPELDTSLRRITENTIYQPGEGFAGQAVASREPVYVSGFESSTGRGAVANAMGFHSALAVPVFVNSDIPIVLEFISVEEIPEVEHLIDVFRHIGVQLGRVAERAALRDRVRQAQKMEAVGQLAAGIAHEINNPMAYVRSNLNSLDREMHDLETKLTENVETASLGKRAGECRELLADSIDGVERTIAIVRDLKELSRSGGAKPNERRVSDLSDLMDGALRVASSHRSPGIRFERSYGEAVLCNCSGNQITQVFVNLIVNAIHAVEGKGTITLETGRDGDQVYARVCDTGHGMTETTRRRLFDPFFTTKHVGEGTGLGLSVSFEIVRSHGGEIRVDSKPRTGASFEVRLPGASAPAA